MKDYTSPVMYGLSNSAVSDDLECFFRCDFWQMLTTCQLTQSVAHCLCNSWAWASNSWGKRGKQRPTKKLAVLHRSRINLINESILWRIDRGKTDWDPVCDYTLQSSCAGRHSKRRVMAVDTNSSLVLARNSFCAYFCKQVMILLEHRPQNRRLAVWKLLQPGIERVQACTR